MVNVAFLLLAKGKQTLQTTVDYGAVDQAAVERPPSWLHHDDSGAATLHGLLRGSVEHHGPGSSPRAQAIAAKLSRKAARVASMSASLWAREVKPAS
jgi:hypothetical protein